eukprot:TRINITY_DN17202_c0_g1_i1.p1 TRINITY_DN17202_c0_g1~~TRINITY_DN17202_c0_g1_i1.p1  ORF type:complete len:246 (+),score=33.50 TRINITY_DN17202_c0_g1_i1:569-1306(+)
MCLPQIGVDPNGSILDRTADEQRVFEACKPHMSMLYSMFPVLLCDEVAPGCTDYISSGWCFSELSVATLGKQLSFLSSSAVQNFQLPQMPSVLQVGALQELKDHFERELTTKIFVYDSDRNDVRDIFNGFFLKAQLRDAIHQKNAPEVHRLLSEIRTNQLRHVLDQPIDRDLNTLLHLAVTRQFSEAIVALLQSGADKNLRNVAGDLPWQWKVFPRLCNAAAKTCRTFDPSAASVSPPHTIGSRV